MNVPLLDVRQKEYLHMQFPLYEKVEQASYTKDILDPVGEEMRRIAHEREERMRNPQYKRPDKKKDADAEKKFLVDRSGGINLQFNDPNKGKDAKDGKVHNRYEVSTALVRYWDFTVEPGRKYKYRMRVKVFNPNYKRTDVADPDSASRIVLTGPWSPVSDEIFVDFDNHWYVAEQKRIGGRTNELLLEVHHWYRGMGEWLVGKMAQRVGQLVGLTEKTPPIKALKWNDVVHEYEVKDLKMESEVDTGNLLVGLAYGSEEYELFGNRRNVAIPREAVALNPYGDLVRHEEQADKQDDVRKSVNENFDDIRKAVDVATGEDKKEEKKEEERPKPGKGKGKGPKGGGAP